MNQFVILTDTSTQQILNHTKFKTPTQHYTDFNQY